MTDPRVTAEKAREYGLLEGEFSTITTALGHVPTYTELRILAAYWSEAFSWKSSIPVLKSLPVIPSGGDSWSNHRIPQPVEVNSNTVILAKISSCDLTARASPEYVATRCTVRLVRELRALGARPISLFHASYVGGLRKRGTKKKVKDLSEAAGNCATILQVKAVGSQLVFDDVVGTRSLFHAVVLGVAAKTPLAGEEAPGDGDPVFLLGPQDFKQDTAETVDLWHESCIGKVCQEIALRSYLVGMRSVSEGGVALACVDLALGGQFGITINVARAPFPRKGMSPSDVLLAEPDGQVVVVIRRGFEKELQKICRDSRIICWEIGVVNPDEVLRAHRRTKEYCSIPMSVFLRRKERPSHELPSVKPGRLDETGGLNEIHTKKPMSWNNVLMALLGSGNILADEKRRIQLGASDTEMDPFVRDGLRKTVVFRSWGSARYSSLDPQVGGRYALAGAARKVVCRGATPRAAVVSFSVGDLENPENFYLFSEGVRGIAEACKELGIPVVNTYVNCQSGIPVPVPVCGVLGFVEGFNQLISPGFKDPDDFILMLGSHRGELGGSEYSKIIHNRVEGPLPLVDLATENRIQEIVLMMNKVGLAKSVRDVSVGGLAVALAHSLIASPSGLGARIHLSSKVKEDELMFGETQGLCLITIGEDSLIEMERLCIRMDVSCTAIGRVTDSGVLSFNQWIRTTVDKLKKLHLQGFRKLHLS